MNPIKHLSFLLSIALCWGCADNPTEKHTGSRNNAVNVHDRIKEIPTEETPIGNINSIYLMADYLMIKDYRSPDMMLLLFDRKTFNYVGSFIPKGEGPGYITRIGHIGVDEARRKFYVTDMGRQKIFAYHLDSLLANPKYMPEEKIKLNETLFPTHYHYISDTFCIGIMMEPIGNSTFTQSVARWNMNTGEITPLKYERINVKRRRLFSAVSAEKGLVVKCYRHFDLMTICTLDGDLKYNIYGPGWNENRNTNGITYYTDPIFYGDRIFALYSGGDTYTEDGQHVNFPTKFHIFDLDGNYLKTLETGYEITGFCYDKENNRLILDMDDDIQFGYLDLAGLVE
ncbi:hypothetical protein FACS1894181_11400 [Bacteroidia bacterium]|nr:hypothetical protein FACS1894181_11400 [Bacteroidia bacterium]